MSDHILVPTNVWVYFQKYVIQPIYASMAIALIIHNGMDMQFNYVQTSQLSGPCLRLSRCFLDN